MCKVGIFSMFQHSVFVWFCLKHRKWRHSKVPFVSLRLFEWICKTSILVRAFVHARMCTYVCVCASVYISCTLISADCTFPFQTADIPGPWAPQDTRCEYRSCLSALRKWIFYLHRSLHQNMARQALMCLHPHTKTSPSSHSILRLNTFSLWLQAWESEGGCHALIIESQVTAVLPSKWKNFIV